VAIYVVVIFTNSARRRDQWSDLEDHRWWECPAAVSVRVPIGGGCTHLRLCGSQKVLGNGIGMIAKADFDGPIEAVNVTIVARSLVCLMLPHEGKKLFSRPTVGFEVVIVRS